VNPRKPIYAMLAAGLLVVAALTFTPYAFISRARKTVTTYVAVGTGAALPETAVPAPTP